MSDALLLPLSLWASVGIFVTLFCSDEISIGMRHARKQGYADKNDRKRIRQGWLLLFAYWLPVISVPFLIVIGVVKYTGPFIESVRRGSKGAVESLKIGFRRSKVDE